MIGQNFSLNRISVSNPRGALRFIVVKGGEGAKMSMQSLKCRRHGRRRPVYLVVAGSPSHLANLFKEYVGGLKGRLKSFSVPSYSPGTRRRRAHLKSREGQCCRAHKTQRTEAFASRSPRWPTLSAKTAQSRPHFPRRSEELLCGRVPEDTCVLVGDSFIHDHAWSKTLQ